MELFAVPLLLLAGWLLEAMELIVTVLYVCVCADSQRGQELQPVAAAEERKLSA